MKVGDLVHDSAYGMGGLIISFSENVRHVGGLNNRYVNVWCVLYEDGSIEEVFENDIMVVR